MTLGDLGNLGEFVGAIAVVVSLLYLATQIRQNSRIVRSTTHHASISSGNAVNFAFADAEAARILLKGGLAYAELDLEERFRFAMLMRASFAFFEDAYLQFREGLMDSDVWDSKSRTLKETLSTPGVREWWTNSGNLYCKAFQEEVAKVLAA